MNNFVTVKTIVDENFQDYKKASMFIVFPKCDFKCFRELSLDASKCQNYEISKMKDIKVSVFEIFKRYTSNPITNAIVLGGLEPFESFNEVYSLISYFRTNGCNDDFVIYTGYYPNEVKKYINELKKFENVIVKFGRFIPDSVCKFDNLLGVNLASSNQYALNIKDVKLNI